ncbi:MAG: hypothetical protein ABR606_05800 [Vicinamibacterales bacterium]
MKTLLKLLIVAVVLHGATRATIATWRHYQFQDAVEEEMIFADVRATPDVLHDRVMELAHQYEIPLDNDALQVTKTGFRTQVSAAYTEQVKLVPRFYEPTWTFDASVDVRAIR